ncbi:MAG TPA: hypothetical protein VJV78_06270 [Polyangiales bacterium]|nr:hypothetical protein [Polyangiales bacterium]
MRRRTQLEALVYTAPSIIRELVALEHADPPEHARVTATLREYLDGQPT